MSLYIGLMSGTSMDGIDAALVDLEQHQLILGLTHHYSNDVKTRLNKLQNEQKHSLKSICQLNTLIGEGFADAVNELLKKAGIASSEVAAIGSHGQTLCHDGYADIPYTMQIGCPHTIAEKTGITVVADFRTRDMVAGGQGAPFAPLYHQALFADSSQNIALINIGGIANISLIMADGGVKGWDVGPGNCLMDEWIRQKLNKAYDHDGNWAKEGRLIDTLLDRLLSDSFFLKKTPKSIGKEYFSLKWLQSHLHEDYLAADIQATLLELAARCISESIKKSKVTLSKVYLCGGGVHNSALVAAISRLLPEISVLSTADKNISPDYVEAMMFAWLAEKTLAHQPIDLRQITGSSHPIIAGSIYPV